jgi:hypothetical protein
MMPTGAIASLVVMLLIGILMIVLAHRMARAKGLDPVFWGVMAALFGPLVFPFIWLAKPRNRDH